MSAFEILTGWMGVDREGREGGREGGSDILPSDGTRGGGLDDDRSWKGWNASRSHGICTLVQLRVVVYVARCCWCGAGKTTRSIDGGVWGMEGIWWVGDGNRLRTGNSLVWDRFLWMMRLRDGIASKKQKVLWCTNDDTEQCVKVAAPRCQPIVFMFDWTGLVALLQIEGWNKPSRGNEGQFAKGGRRCKPHTIVRECWRHHQSPEDIAEHLDWYFESNRVRSWLCYCFLRTL